MNAGAYDLGKGKSGTTRRVNVFVSYSHKDERLREEVEKHLSALRRSKSIGIWNDHRISPGNEVDAQVAAFLGTSDLVLLLVSPDFMDSNYCYVREMKEALKRHRRGDARVIPVVLRPVDWSKTPIGKLLALPRNGKPVTSWNKRDEALLDVAKGIRRVVEEIQAKRAMRPRVRGKRTIVGVRGARTS